jgi:hypothetical protein
MKNDLTLLLTEYMYIVVDVRVKKRKKNEVITLFFVFAIFENFFESVSIRMLLASFVKYSD